MLLSLQIIQTFIFDLVVIIMLFLYSCSFPGSKTSKNDEFNNPLSRETVNELVSGVGFGKGRTDVEAVILDYVYHDSTFAEKYGNDFCVDDMGGTDEGNTFFFLWLYQASGDYFVVINGDTWWISVSKSYFGKWEVMGCYRESNAEGASVSSTENPDN